LALEAILKGEQDLAEAGDADQDLLIKLGMVPAQSGLPPKETEDDEKQEVRPRSGRSQKRQPGERKPGRDSVGPKPDEEPGGEAYQAVG
jgi:hypothetical protein